MVKRTTALRRSRGLLFCELCNGGRYLRTFQWEISSPRTQVSFQFFAICIILNIYKRFMLKKLGNKNKNFRRSSTLTIIFGTNRQNYFHANSPIQLFLFQKRPCSFYWWSGYSLHVYLPYMKSMWLSKNDGQGSSSWFFKDLVIRNATQKGLITYTEPKNFFCRTAARNGFKREWSRDSRNAARPGI